jgi:hypothetical protein
MTDEAMSPLRRRMIEDMTIRKLAPKTQHDYSKIEEAAKRVSDTLITRRLRRGQSIPRPDRGTCGAVRERLTISVAMAFHTAGNMGFGQRLLS